MSVFEVTNPGRLDNDEPVAGGLYDPRFGVWKGSDVCVTCGGRSSVSANSYDCPGHFAHLEVRGAVAVASHSRLQHLLLTLPVVLLAALATRVPRRLPARDAQGAAVRVLSLLQTAVPQRRRRRRHQRREQRQATAERHGAAVQGHTALPQERRCRLQLFAGVRVRWLSRCCCACAWRRDVSRAWLCACVRVRVCACVCVRACAAQVYQSAGRAVRETQPCRRRCESACWQGGSLRCRGADPLPHSISDRDAADVALASVHCAGAGHFP